MFCGCSARFVLDLVGNPVDRLSHDKADMHLICFSVYKRFFEKVNVIRLQERAIVLLIKFMQ